MKEWLITQLSHKDAAKRETALKTLEGLGSAGVELVLDVLRAEARKKRKQRRCAYWALGIYLSIILAMMLVWVGHGLTTHHWGRFPTAFFQFFNIFSIFSAVAAASAAQKDGTKWLARLPDPRHIGVFLDALETNGDKETREAAISALTVALPNLTPQDAEPLSPEQRAILRAQLKSANKDFALAILHALPVMADTAAIPTVEAYVHRLQGQKKREPELLAAARESLAALEELRERAREKETLLRPAEAVAGEHLLRATITPAETDPAVLLRPTNSA